MGQTRSRARIMVRRQLDSTICCCFLVKSCYSLIKTGQESIFLSSLFDQTHFLPCANTPQPRSIPFPTYGLPIVGMSLSKSLGFRASSLEMSRVTWFSYFDDMKNLQQGSPEQVSWRYLMFGYQERRQRGRRFLEDGAGCPSPGRRWTKAWLARGSVV